VASAGALGGRVAADLAAAEGLGDGRAGMTARVVGIAAATAWMLMASGSGRGARVGVAAVPSAAARPNVVVVMADDLDSRSYGRLLRLGLLPSVETALVERGVTFRNSFVTNPLCCPSRATFLTGQYSHNNRVLSNAPPNGGVLRLDDRSTLATWLRAAGYRTSMVGKYLNYYGLADMTRDGATDVRDALYVPPGWDDWQALVDPSTYLMYQYTINDNGRLVTYGDAPADYQTDVLAARAARFIDASEAADGVPFFLAVFTSAPHNELWPTIPADTYQDLWPWSIRPAPRHAGSVTLDLPPTPSFNEADLGDKPPWLRAHPLLTAEDVAYARRKYQDRLAATRAVDDLVGTVVQALVRNDELQTTVLVFTSDNGYLIGEHRLPEKLYAYEESIRVPLVVAVPGGPAGNAGQLVLNNDLAPTIAEMAGATPALAVDGRSFLPLLDDPAREPWRKRFLVEHWAVDSDPMGLHDAPDYAAVRTPSLTYVEYDDGVGSREFYDSAVDPFQLTSLHADTSPTRVYQMSVLAGWLATLRACGRGTCQGVEFWAAN
jgi:arylsulfatase A-like enzyme